MQAQETHPAEEHPEHHPSDRQYVNVFIILFLVTALEVAIYYVTALKDLLVPFLIAFAVVKFALVALWFMHLRFDSRVFRRFFLVGIVLALFAFGLVLLIFFWALGGPSPHRG